MPKSGPLRRVVISNVITGPEKLKSPAVSAR